MNLKDAETYEQCDQAEHAEHEQRRGHIEHRDQPRSDCQSAAGPELPDGVGHRAEGADRCSLHDDGDHAEHRICRVIDDIAKPVAAFAERHQRKTEQDGKQKYLQDVAARPTRRPRCPE